MSLKSIELQIAIPKTFEAGKVAEQKQQQSLIAQENAQMANEKQAQKNKESVLQSEAYAKLSDDQERGSEEQQQKDSKKKKKEDEQQGKHPFKGSLFDFSG